MNDILRICTKFMQHCPIGEKGKDVHWFNVSSVTPCLERSGWLILDTLRGHGGGQTRSDLM